MKQFAKKICFNYLKVDVYRILKGEYGCVYRYQFIYLNQKIECLANINIPNIVKKLASKIPIKNISPHASSVLVNTPLWFTTIWQSESESLTQWRDGEESDMWSAPVAAG